MSAEDASAEDELAMCKERVSRDASEEANRAGVRGGV